MRLNPDCIRDVLLQMEECPFNTVLTIPVLMGHLPEYSKEDICYTCLKLREGGFITAVLSDVQRNYMPEVVCLMDITYRGHEFLNGVRDPKIWVKIKNVAKLAGNTAIQTLGTIALEVAKKIALEAILSQDV